MKTNKITQAITALVLSGIALPVMAAGQAVQADQDGWYLGFGGGAARATIAEREIVADLTSAGYLVTDFKEDDRDFGYKLFAGYQFNQYFALEGGYFDMGKFNYTATTQPDGMSSGELDFRGWNLDLMGLMPLSERSKVFARLGAHRGRAAVNYTGSGGVNVLTPYYQKTSTDFKLGVGYEYRMSDNLAIRAEVERYRMDDAVGNSGDIDLYTLNFIYRFGGPTHQVKATEPRREALTPTVTPVVAPVVVATEKYCSALEIEFEIANNDIQRVNREQMLVLATFLEKYPESKVVLEGHTDSVGNDADNLKLSQQRAQSSLDYLVREHGIDRSRLSAVGYGETRPIASNETDAGKQANRRIHAVIACATDIEGLKPMPARVTLAMELEFAADDSTIDPKYHTQLASVGKYLQTNPDLTATLEGHTDNASPARAEQVSRARAQSVADYLVREFKIDRSRLTVEGFGASRRDTYNKTAGQRQDNRRVSIIIGYPN